MTKGKRGRTVVLLTAIALTLSACAWGQAGGNAARNGANPYEPGLTADNVSRLALAWQNKPSYGEPVIDAKYIYAIDHAGYVNAFAAGGPAAALGAPRCSGSPVVCTPVWSARLSATAPVSDPVVNGAQVFASAQANGQWKLFALNADPQDCPDTINRCEPTWVGQWGAPHLPQATPVIAVAGGRVYVSTPPDNGGNQAHLAVFDEAGTAGCTPGAPRTCTPLFQVDTPRTQISAPSIAVAADRLFIEGTNETLVFDAAGRVGCTNGFCSPLYRLASGSARGVSVFGTTAYAATGMSLAAFDATGSTGCAGSPIVCQPRWTASLRAPATGDLPTVSNDTVMVVESPDGPTDPGVEAFDASGDTGCAGAPKVCTPLWTVTRGGMAGDVNHLSATPTLLIVSGWSVIPFNPPILRQTLKTFDLAGTIGCDGTPKVCYALSTTEVGTDIGILSPAVAFGRIAVTDSIGQLKVFAVAGP